MTDGVITFQPDQRDEDGYYLLFPGNTHVFEFTMPTVGTLNISLTHTLQSAQDSSLNCWFSSKPLDGVMFQYDSELHNFQPGRATRTINLQSEADATAGRTLYFNISNLQNKLNGYTLMFVES